MRDLIVALEAAAEGSRELDARIWALDAAIPGPVEFSYEVYGDGPRRESVKRGSLGAWLDEIPSYTTSIDAALTLAGDDWFGVLLSALAQAATYFVTFRDKNGHIRKKLILWCCIAALKAGEQANG